METKFSQIVMAGPLSADILANYARAKDYIDVEGDPGYYLFRGVVPFSGKTHKKDGVKYSVVETLTSDVAEVAKTLTEQVILNNLFGIDSQFLEDSFKRIISNEEFKEFYTKDPEAVLDEGVEKDLSNDEKEDVKGVFIATLMKMKDQQIATVLYNATYLSKVKSYSAQVEETKKAILRSDFRIIRERFGKEFRRLFKGDYSAYESNDDAILSLLKMICYRAGNDILKIKALYGESVLSKKSLKTEASLDNLIKEAIVSRKGIYHTSEYDTVPFIEYDDNKGCDVINVSLLADWVRAHNSLFSIPHAGSNQEEYFMYNGRYFEQITEKGLASLAQNAIRSYNESYRFKNSDIESAWKIMQRDLKHLSVSEINPKHEICFGNGILDLTDAIRDIESGFTDSKDWNLTLTATSPEKKHIRILNADWSDKDIPTPNFDKYLAFISGGNESVKRFLLQFLGAIISNVEGWRYKKCVFICGRGNTGKSQFISLVEAILGENSYETEGLDDLEARFGIGQIQWTRMIANADMGHVNAKEIGTFKKLTGGDSLKGEMKGKDKFTVRFNGFLLFGMNDLPDFKGDRGSHVFERIVIVECNNVVKEENRDRNLLSKMVAERDGIVRKAILAFLPTMANDRYRFDEPDNEEELRRNYRISNSPELKFAVKFLKPSPFKNDEAHKRTSVYNRFKDWYKVEYHGPYQDGDRVFFNTIMDFYGVEKEDFFKKTGDGFLLRNFAYCEDKEGESHSPDYQPRLPCADD